MQEKKVFFLDPTGVRTRVAQSKVRRSTNLATGAEKKFGPKFWVFEANATSKIILNLKYYQVKRTQIMFWRIFALLKWVFAIFFL